MSAPLLVTYVLAKNTGGIEYYVHELHAALRGAEGFRDTRVLSLWPAGTRPTGGKLTKLRRRLAFHGRISALGLSSALGGGPGRILVMHPSLLLTLPRALRRRSITFCYGIEFWNERDPAVLAKWADCGHWVGISHDTNRRLRELLAKGGAPRPRIDLLMPPAAGPANPGSALAHSLANYRKGDPFRILTLGRQDAREGYKGTDLVLQAIARLGERGKNIRFQIAGSGTDLPRLQALCRELGLESQVEFLGYQSADKIPTLYSSAHLFAMPSGKILPTGEVMGEGFGIVFQEAASHGVPSLGARLGGTTDAIVDGETGLLSEPDDVTSTASAIARLSEDPELLRSLGQRAFARWQAEFNPERFQEKVRVLAQGWRATP